MFRRLGLRPQLVKRLLYIFIVAACFVMAYIKDVNAAAGIVFGNVWQAKTVEIARVTVEGAPHLILKLSNSELSGPCEEKYDANDLLLEIPVNTRNGLPNYSDTRVRVAGENKELPCFSQIRLNHEDLFKSGLAYIRGSLNLVSDRANTEIAGTFKARVCNSIKKL
jgi:hypothetical protein